MNIYLRGIVSGFVATIALSIVMVLKSAVGLFPAFNVIKLLAGLSHHIFGLPATPVIGWIAHFFIGTILWGLLFAALHRYMPGKSTVTQGLSFSVIAWLLMMLIPLPLAGAGLFGLHLAAVVPVVTLVLHLIWGLVLGAMFAVLERKPPMNTTA